MKITIKIKKGNAVSSGGGNCGSACGSCGGGSCSGGGNCGKCGK